jgi:hypothetical protein
MFYLSFAFMASGALNYGVTAYFWALPFVYYAFRYVTRHFESRRPLLGLVAFTAVGLLINATLEKNPLVFPILVDGYLQEVRPAAGGTGSASGEPLGERLGVTAVQVSHADLGTAVLLIASNGRTYYRASRDQLFYPYSDGKRSEFGLRPSGPVESPVFQYAGTLMLYPWLPLVPFIK